MEGAGVDPVHEDRFIVFIRLDPGHGERPEANEHAVVTCSTYAEARRIRRQCLRSNSDCVIRFVGPAGGGD
jgi:hypothetical protein